MVSPSCLCFWLRRITRGGLRHLVVASFCPAGVVGLIAKLCQLVVEFLHRGFLLFQQIGDQSPLAVLQTLLFRKECFDVVGTLLVRHASHFKSSSSMSDTPKAFFDSESQD